MYLLTKATDKKMTTFTNEEQKTIATLIRLGDSEKLAKDTVLDLRSRNTGSEIYARAYYS